MTLIRDLLAVLSIATVFGSMLVALGRFVARLFH